MAGGGHEPSGSHQSGVARTKYELRVSLGVLSAGVVVEIGYIVYLVLTNSIRYFPGPPPISAPLSPSFLLILVFTSIGPTFISLGSLFACMYWYQLRRATRGG